MTAPTAPPGPAPSAQLHTPAELVPIVRRRANAIRDALNDRTLHGHRAQEKAKSRWLIPLVCALAWVAGRDEAYQGAACPLCAAGAPPAPRNRRR